MIRHVCKNRYLYLLVALLELGCAKISSKNGGNGSVQPLNPSAQTQMTITDTTPPPQEPQRAHTFAVLNAPPPRASTQHGTTVIFDGVDSNLGGGYSPTTGIFRAVRTAFYDIQVMLQWPASAQQASALGVCQTWLNISGAPFPGAMVTSPYPANEMCTNLFSVKLVLQAGQPLFISASTNTSGGTLVDTPGRTYGYISITEDR